MTNFQIKKAELVKQNIDSLKQERIQRYQLLKNAITINNQFSLCFDDDNGQYFKIVFNVHKQPDVFKLYLLKHQIPYYNLHADIFKNRDLAETPLFTKYAPSIFEISCERSITLVECERIVKLLINY